MKEVKMPHDAIVLIGDGRKALFLRNHGDEKFPDLRIEVVDVADHVDAVEGRNREILDHNVWAQPPYVVEQRETVIYRCDNVAIKSE